MPTKEPEEYLALAQHAEKAAETVPGEVAKDCWRLIAREYRKLAAEKQKEMQAAREAKKPS